MKKSALMLMVLTLISRILGLGREMVLSYFYGTSYISDAYLVSSMIPTTFFALIGVGISTGYIPMYTKIEKLRGEKEANIYTNNLINIIMIVFITIICIGMIFTPQIVKLFASGFDAKTLHLTVKFTKITILGICFSGLVYIFQGFLQIKGDYFMGGILGIPLNLCMIVFIILSNYLSIIFLPIGIVIATIIQLIVLIPPSIKQGYKYIPIVRPRDEYIKEMLFLALPVILGVGVNDLNVLIDRNIASQIAIGGISALDYARKINDLIQGVYILSISTVIFPVISKLAIEKNFDKLASILTIALKIIFIIVIPATVGLMIFSEEIVQIMFGRGAFDADSVAMTSKALGLYSLGMVAYGTRQVLIKVFYAMQDTKIPVRNSIIGISINILLNLILAKKLGISGLALSTSISAIITALLMIRAVNKKINIIDVKNMIISVSRISLISILMGIIGRITFNYLIIRYDSLIVCTFVSISISIVCYLVLLVMAKIVSLNELKQQIKSIRNS